MVNDCFIEFKAATESYDLPKRFTFPFYYKPNPLSILAVKELQNYLATELTSQHNFGLDSLNLKEATGKMFGVLVVKKNNGEIGYLAAFSGKFSDNVHPKKFVPSIFDLLADGNFLSRGLKEITKINKEIKRLESSSDYLADKTLLDLLNNAAIEDLSSAKNKINRDKKERKNLRTKKAKELSPELFKTFNDRLIQKSLGQKFYLKHLTLHWEEKILKSKEQINQTIKQINELKKRRKTNSAALQQQLFKQYDFLNQKGEKKNLLKIFENATDPIPPAGSGECAAPKLLQYAFLNKLTPICMAEFWWGISPKSEIRKHQHYYPACQGKCKPILTHMLEGIKMDGNPLLINHATDKKIDIVFEDDELLVINKPPNLPSVPGNNIQDSVFQRIKKMYPLASGPLIVHRLDMSTSGIMIIAKNKISHKYLQSQFIKRSIKKRYIAILEAEINNDKGSVNLPLRGDLNDRPRQLVCYEHGKTAKTNWEVISKTNGQTKIHFYPVTGRTHQLRVHAAHRLGLCAPILGDDLYGTAHNRLYLHADLIEFIHPLNKKVLTIEIPAEF